MDYDVTFVASDLVELAKLPANRIKRVKLQDDSYNLEFMAMVQFVRELGPADKVRLMVDGAAISTDYGVRILVKAG